MLCVIWVNKVVSEDILLGILLKSRTDILAIIKHTKCIKNETFIMFMSGIDLSVSKYGWDAFT